MHLVIRILGALLFGACAVAPAGAGQADPQPPPAAEPFFRARERPAQYAGPGREVPDPADVDAVRIGYFGPDDPSDPDGGDLWGAARMAVEEANARGGYRGKPFRLVPGWSQNPWGTGVAQLSRIVYRDKVWAVIGGIDGPSTHLAEQVVAKARLALVCPAATDKTVNLANVPWMFSCLPGDHLLARALASAVAERIGTKPLVIASADDHDSHLFAVELRKGLAERGIAARYHFECKALGPGADELAERLVASRAEAIVLVAGARGSARLVAAVRRKGFAGPIFGGPAMGRRRFLDEAGPAAEGVVFPLLYLPGQAADGFARAFRTRYGRQPDYAAAHTYDAVRLLVAAIGRAGLNRARIGDALRQLSPWTGVTGTMTWDPLGSNRREVRLGTVRDGAVVPLAACGGGRVASGGCRGVVLTALPGAVPQGPAPR